VLNSDFTKLESVHEELLCNEIDISWVPKKHKIGFENTWKFIKLVHDAISKQRIFA
jgi:hypothetical protein